MIYVDEMGHMVSNTSVDELHKFAGKIGLKREWFQDKQIPHYDLTTGRKLKYAIKKGATLITAQELIIKYRTGAIND